MMRKWQQAAKKVKAGGKGRWWWCGVGGRQAGGGR